MAKYIFLAAWILMSVAAGAQSPEKQQQKKSCSCAFSSINQLGFLEGSRGSSFQLQTINGVQYKTWFVGAGLGLEYYHLRSIPLFLDVRKNILKKPTSPFVYADGGIQFAWAREKDKQSFRGSEFSNGPFFDAGVGVRFGINKNALLLSMGYSYKYSKESYYLLDYCGFINCEQQRSVYRYRLNRLSLKAGWQL